MTYKVRAGQSRLVVKVDVCHDGASVERGIDPVDRHAVNPHDIVESVADGVLSLIHISVFPPPASMKHRYNPKSAVKRTADDGTVRSDSRMIYPVASGADRQRAREQHYTIRARRFRRV